MYENDMFIDQKLPAPLNNEELLECIRCARNGNLEARDEIIIHNIKLVLSLVLKKIANVPYEKKELVSVGIIGLIKATDTFDITKNFNFSTYAVSCINNEILTFTRKGKKFLREESLKQLIVSDSEGKKLSIEDTIAAEDADFAEDVINKEFLLEVRRQVDMLADRDREIIKLYFGFYDGKQYSQKEIGSMMGLDQSYVSRIIKRVVNVIGKKLEAEDVENAVKEEASTGQMVLSLNLNRKK